MDKYAKITINNGCLRPELFSGQIVDGLVNFDFNAIELGSFVVYSVGGAGHMIKKVIGLSGDAWEVSDGFLIIGDYKRLLSERHRPLLDGYNEVVPTNCLLVCSNESPDRFVVILHLDNITHHIPLSEVPKV